MKKNSTIYTIKMLAFTLMAVAAISKPAICQEPAVDNDLIIYSIAVSPDQRVKFRFPLDIRSGDRITGTVVEEKKSSKGVDNKSSATLEGVVIEIDGKQTKLSNRIISFLVPSGITSLPFLLKNATGETIQRGELPVRIVSNLITDAPYPLNGTDFFPTVVCQPGQPLTISGNFDGNASNTNVSLGGQNCDVIAESNRMSIVQVPQEATAGVSNLKVEENNIKEEHKINIAKLNLSANKTTLRKGEKAIITVTVSGLEGLKEGYNCKVDITNNSPATVRFKSNTGNSMSHPIPSGQTGEYKFTFSIVGVTQGNYVLDGVLFCTPPPR